MLYVPLRVGSLLQLASRLVLIGIAQVVPVRRRITCEVLAHSCFPRWCALHAACACGRLATAHSVAGLKTYGWQLQSDLRLAATPNANGTRYATHTLRGHCVLGSLFPGHSVLGHWAGWRFADPSPSLAQCWLAVVAGWPPHTPLLHQRQL
jgi:hypothetical protein